MKVLDLAVIGSGIGGSLISSLNSNKNLILFEKDKNLGGCASTFKKNDFFFNAGATTFVGYEKNHPVKRIFDKCHINPSKLEKSPIAIRIIQNKKVIDRIKDFDIFIENINRVYPNKNNEIFWKKLKDIDEKFWHLKNVYFSKYSIKSYMKTTIFLYELLMVFKFDIFRSAKSFIKETLGEISTEYQNFIDAQLLITIQTKSNDIPLLSLALGLSYPFHDIFYVKGGMGSIFDDILKNVITHKKEKVIKILKYDKLYKIKTTRNEYLARNIVLNSTIYDCSKLFEDNDIKKYYNKYKFNNQSAFVVYLKLDIKEEFLHHYQIILNSNIVNCISNSFFVSFSDIKDKVLSNNGLSVTISTHTKADYWKDISCEEYKLQKEKTMSFIIKEFLNYFDNIKEKNIINKFAGTSKTFNNYINRFNCGGSSISMKNILNLPSCKTPFKGLYNIGDTVFAGQGWPGVALGVEVLDKEINEKF